MAARETEGQEHTEPTLDPAALARWEGRQDTRRVRVDPQPARLMQATLGKPPSLTDGAPLPPLWHWLYMPPEVPTAGLGLDGHPRLGGFLPPVALPRRMWAGSSVRFLAPIHVGDTLEVASVVSQVRLKSGRSGPLCFVTVTHSWSDHGTVRLEEAQDLVYRADPAPEAPEPTPPQAPDGALWRHAITPHPVLLFRYSAITFNSHRIHYDRPYAQDIEGYGGLVVHGPLTATLLMEAARQEAQLVPRRFRFRGVSPLLDTAAFTLNGRREGDGWALWAATAAGALAMEAHLEGEEGSGH